MAKMALCIKRQDLVDLNRILRYPELNGQMLADAPAEFLRLATTLEDRATCETDPSLLQLLPYVLIQRADTGQYFMYCRGKGGAEARLHGNLSIGVGGHVDTAAPKTVQMFEGMDTIESDLMAHLDNEAVREVTEELGIRFLAQDEDPAEVEFQDLMEVPPNMWTGTLIYDDTNEVGKVHLGLLFTLVIADASVLGSEEVGVIEGSQWLHPHEFLNPDVYSRLENWSKIVATTLQELVEEEEEEEDEADEADEADATEDDIFRLPA